MEELEIGRFLWKVHDKEEPSIEDKTTILTTPEIVDYIVNNYCSKDFKKLMEQLGNPKEMIDSRKSLEEGALSNIRNISSTIGKDVISQIYFEDYAENTLYTIETILERIETNEEFKSKIDAPIISFLREVKSFLDADDELYFSPNLEPFIDRLDKYQQQLKLGKNSSINNEITKVFLFTQQDFLTEVEDSLNTSNILEGINPKDITSSEGLTTKIYSLECQTPNQQSFHILTRSSRIFDYMLTPNAKQEYLENMSQYGYLSYSLNNEEIYESFSGKYHVIFGYFSTQSNPLMSANTHDGQTNQYKLKDNFYVKKQEYLGLEEFMSKTDSYNELVLKNIKVLLPDCIMVTSLDIPDKIITIASSFNIPIVYISPEYYKEHKPINPVTEKERKKWYNHFRELKYQLSDCLADTYNKHNTN